MEVDQASAGTTRTLSTGHTVELPLVTEASMYGAVFSAPRGAVEELLPAGVRPIRATPSGKAAVTLLSVEYHHIGVEGIEPYNEFSVIFPAVHGSTPTVPSLSALYRATNGNVWYLPVTTEPAKALGVDDLIYVNNSYIYALGRASGKQQWISSYETNSSQQPTPAVVGDQAHIEGTRGFSRIIGFLVMRYGQAEKGDLKGLKEPI